MKHRLVVIGWMGLKRCYLDMSKEEALARFDKQEDPIRDERIVEFEFDDEFGAYDAYSLEGGK